MVCPTMTLLAPSTPTLRASLAFGEFSQARFCAWTAVAMPREALPTPPRDGIKPLQTTGWPDLGFQVIIPGFAACRLLHISQSPAREQETTAVFAAVNMGYRHPLIGEVRLQAALLFTRQTGQAAVKTFGVS